MPVFVHSLSHVGIVSTLSSTAAYTVISAPAVKYAKSDVKFFESQAGVIASAPIRTLGISE